MPEDQEAPHERQSVHVEEVGCLTKGFEYTFLVGTLGLWSIFGVYSVKPRQCVVVLHNGRVTKVTHMTGLHWAPAWFSEKDTIYTGETAYGTGDIKVVDKSGVPIVVSAIIVYKVVDVLKAAFEVSNYTSFVRTQATAALKAVVQKYSYDELKIEGNEVGRETVVKLQEKVTVAGVQVESMVLNELK